MLERALRKGNPLTLLIGMQTGTASMENSVEIPLKTGNRAAIWPSNLLLGMHTKEKRIERHICTPMFIAALFTTARTWKPPRCPSADEYIRTLWYIYTVECYPAVIRNAFCREPAWEIPPMTRPCGRDLTSKADQDLRDPLDLLEHLPQNQNLSYYFVPFTNSSDVNRGLSLTTFLWKKST